MVTVSGRKEECRWEERGWGQRTGQRKRRQTAEVRRDAKDGHRLFLRRGNDLWCHGRCPTVSSSVGVLVGDVGWTVTVETSGEGGS